MAVPSKGVFNQESLRKAQVSQFQAKEDTGPSWSRRKGFSASCRALSQWGKGGFHAWLVMSLTLPTSSGVETQQQGPPLGEGDCTAGLSLAGARQWEAALREAEEGSPGRPRPLCAWGLVVKAQEELHQELTLPWSRGDSGDGSGSSTGGLLWPAR